MQGGGTDGPEQAAEELISALDAVGRGGKKAVLSESPPIGDEALSKPDGRKLWDLPSKLRCPIIGTCLEVSELRRIAAKGGRKSEQPLSDYGVHSSFVAAAKGKNALSLRGAQDPGEEICRLCPALYQGQGGRRRYRAVEGSTVRGPAPGAFWALMTHPESGERTLSLPYKDVHMLSHRIGTGRHAGLEALAQVRGELHAPCAPVMKRRCAAPSSRWKTRRVASKPYRNACPSPRGCKPGWTLPRPGCKR